MNSSTQFCCLLLFSWSGRSPPYPCHPRPPLFSALINRSLLGHPFKPTPTPLRLSLPRPPSPLSSPLFLGPVYPSALLTTLLLHYHPFHPFIPSFAPSYSLPRATFSFSPAFPTVSTLPILAHSTPHPQIALS